MPRAGGRGEITALLQRVDDVTELDRAEQRESGARRVALRVDEMNRLRHGVYVSRLLRREME
jgi:hypothetical protein